MSHDNGCECEACRDGIEAVRAKQAEMMKKYGWVADLVRDDEDCPYGVNLHTHGLEESFNHPDLQVCLPLDPSIGHGVLSAVVSRIKEGRKFKDCEEVEGVLQKGFSVMFVEAEEGGRKVLRVILPDAEGRLKPEEIDGQYRCQYKGTIYLLSSGKDLDCEDVDA